jgi:YegS/Rv2252/BmrU family lipid kinase
LAAIEKDIAVLCNPLAGVGKALSISQTLKRVLEKKGIRHRLYVGDWPDNLSEHSDAWIVGGDGTLNHFVNQYVNNDLPLAVFNGGTGNDFYWLLYGNMKLEEQIETVLKTSPKPIDLGKCNDRFFLNDVGIGFEGEVARRLTGRKKRPGQASFMATVIRTIFTYRSRNYTLYADGQLLSQQRFLVLDVNNGRRAGGGFHVAPEARADDGLFDIIGVDAMGVPRRLRWLPVIEKGNHLSCSFVHYNKARTVQIESDQPIEAHLDGEYYVASSMKIEMLPSRLRFCF